jgi:hypothetical protein
VTQLYPAAFLELEAGLLLPWRFDLSLRSQLQAPALLDHIARVGQVLYRRG